MKKKTQYAGKIHTTLVRKGSRDIFKILMTSFEIQLILITVANYITADLVLGLNELTMWPSDLMVLMLFVLQCTDYK